VNSYKIARIKLKSKSIFLLNNLTEGINKMKNLKKISISTKVKAPLSLVWRVWTNPDHIIHWNFAADSWHCPAAESDLREGGKFSYRMEAKDNSFGFDFKGEFIEVKPFGNLAFKLDDERRVWVNFEQQGDEVDVREEFEAEGDNPLELQRQGWKAILDNFKLYAEDLCVIDKLYFNILIEAPVKDVFRTMLDDMTYREWTSFFHPGSFYRGKWEEGERILFIGPDEQGHEGGMASKVVQFIPNKQVSLQHYGLYENGKEITEGPEVRLWAGSKEEYFFEQKNGGTEVKVVTDTNREYKDYFLEVWPKALEKLKEICETVK
jgi:uncharacterized protein YndB with AHSA1/START domain